MNKSRALLFAVSIAVCWPGRARAPGAIRISDEAGEDHRAVIARRRHRYGDPAARTASLGKTRPQLLHREPAGGGQHDGHRSRRALGAGRLHTAGRRQHHDQPARGPGEDALRRRQGLRSDHACWCRSRTCWSFTRRCRRNRSPSSSRWPSRSPASCRLRRPASARRCTWRWSCSRSKPASTCCTCRTTAWRRH